ncbi:MAG: LD-carboxypeptidase [Desulfobulbaceae bacterium]|nr:LD-carboxypeptidase [Desulfobulbaceae bacterium]
MNDTTINILPPRLQRGDTIGIIAPAGPIRDREQFTAGIRLIREMGFEVKFDRDIYRREGYLAGTDEQRANEFNTLWADPEVKALFAARGGYGSLRIATGIDMELIRRHPKILVGFSDLTVLLCAAMQKAGLITFHGPTVSTLTDSDQYSATRLFDTIASPRPPESIKPERLEIIASGNALGRIVGGNLTNLCHLTGTPFEPDWRQAILFLEDIGETTYRVDRMLTHLAIAGKLAEISGLLLGDFTDCGDIEAIWQRALELTGGNIPVWGNFPTGHGKQNFTMPMGLPAEMDSTERKVRFNTRCTTDPA